jgi:tRNA(Ile)-lysidine synthase
VLDTARAGECNTLKVHGRERPAERLIREVAMSHRLHPLERAVLDAVPAAGRVLLGVSGGADSLALLHAAARALPDAGRRLVAVHVHHGLRGAAADRDAAWVIRQCGAVGVPCAVYRRRVRHEAQRRGWSLEAAGRWVRQACFLDGARNFRARAVCVAHHQDDQAETLLLNLLRGAGARGLAGLRPRRAFPHPAAPAGLVLLRPFLRFPKSELTAYLRSLGVRWRRDATNLDPAFARNRLRTRVLPYLERTVRADARARLARSAEALERDDAWLEDLAARRLARLRAPRPGRTLRWPVAVLNAWPEPLRLRAWSHAWDRLGLPAKHAEHLLQLDGLARVRAGRLSLPGGWTAERRGGDLVWSPPASASRPPAGPASRVPRFGVELRWIDPPASPRVPRGADFFFADAEKLTAPLTVRTRRPGDALRVLGLGGRRKDLKKVFAEMGVPQARRASWPLLCMGPEILWVYRGPLSESVRLGPGSRRAVRVRLVRQPGSG